MIIIAQQILGITLGSSAYDDIIVLLAALLGLACIFIIIYVLKKLIP